MGHFTLFLALKCYTCTVTQTDIDQTCATDPGSVTSGSAITDCDKAYCTIVRIEYLVSFVKWLIS